MLCATRECPENGNGTVTIGYALISMAIVSALLALGPTQNDAIFTAIAGAVSAVAP